MGPLGGKGALSPLTCLSLQAANFYMLSDKQAVEASGMAEWTAGWFFHYGDHYYWVGAPDAEAAKRLLAQHNPEAAKTEPERLANGAGYISLALGQVLAGKVGN